MDTSALAKWYINEAESDEVEAYLQANGPVDISSLTVVEMRSLLARRRRNREVDAATEMRAWAVFEEDIREGHLLRHPAPDGLFDAAAHLLSAYSSHPLRSLDALHLAVAKEIQAKTVVCADKVFANGASAMGFSVVRFGD